MVDRPPVQPPVEPTEEAEFDRIWRKLTELDLKVSQKPVARALRIAFDDLTDVEWITAHPERAPKDHQVATWDAARQLVVPGGGAVVGGYEYDVGVGDLSVGFDLIDGWDVTKACHVDATLLIGPAFAPVLISGDLLVANVVIDGGAPVDVTFPEASGLQGYVPLPLATLQLIDGSAGPGAPSADTEVATCSWSVADPLSIGTPTGGPVAWTFTGGTPHIEANIAGVDTDAWPETHTIYVVWRLTPLP